MKKSPTDNDSNLVLVSKEEFKCHSCGNTMKKVSWRITAGAHDAGKEVEQTVFKCERCENTLCIEMTTGKNSEFAVGADISFTKRDDFFEP